MKPTFKSSTRGCIYVESVDLKFFEGVADMHVVDTHEHTYPYEVLTSKGLSIIDILEGSYVFWVTEPPEDRSDYRSLVERLRRISGSAFYKACSIAVKELYGVDIDPPTVEALEEASRLIREAYRDPRWIREVFKEKSLIDTALLDPYWDVWGGSFDPDLFKPVFRINMFLFGYSREARDHNGNTPYLLEKPLNLEVHSFDDYLELVDRALKEAKRRGYVALKSALAYDRPIRFEEVDEDEARRVFEKKGVDVTSRDVRAFGDFMLHYILGKAEDMGFPVQFHTGLALIEGSNPMNLVNLLRKYVNVRFILFHGGYPWIRETLALALSFRNVYLDLCWLPIISPSACKIMLREAIELGLSGRLMWGGDCWVAEATYGALKMFKSVLSDVLKDMVEKDHLTFDEALDIASKILKWNAVELFNL